ncbi:hypothetical protein BSLG_008458 [Batrachochytrium salamandrivorans]|nr:hypothetical protein BSLG_008458 [Batrachochytrium salamandrivorans]
MVKLEGLSNFATSAAGVDGDRLDEQLRERYERTVDGYTDNELLAHGLASGIDDDNPNANNETFGHEAVPLAANFDYSSSSLPRQASRHGSSQQTPDGSPMSASKQLQQKNELAIALQQRRLMRQQEEEREKGNSGFGINHAMPVPPEGIPTNIPISNLHEIEAQMQRQARMGASVSPATNNMMMMGLPSNSLPGKISPGIHPHSQMHLHPGVYAGARPMQDGGFPQPSPQNRSSMMNMLEVEAAIRSRQAQFGMHPQASLQQSVAQRSLSPPVNAAEIEAMMSAQYNGGAQQMRFNPSSPLQQQSSHLNYEQAHPSMQHLAQQASRSMPALNQPYYESSPPAHHSPNLMVLEEQFRRQQIDTSRNYQKMQPQPSNMQGQLDSMQHNANAAPEQSQQRLETRQPLPLHELQYAAELENEIGFEDAEYMPTSETDTKVNDRIVHAAELSRQEELIDERDVPIFSVDADDDFPALGVSRNADPKPNAADHRSKGAHHTMLQKKHMNQRERRQADQRVPINLTHRERDQPAPDDQHLPREERYNGLMRKFEMEYIAKIQVSNLFTEDPFKDDFYCQVYTLHKKEKEAAAIASSSAGGSSEKPTDGATSAGLNWQQSLFVKSSRKGGKGSNAMFQVQQQMKRIIEGRKQRPREQTLALEGTLGKITPKSARNPKKVIQVLTSSTSETRIGGLSGGSVLSARVVLKNIEQVYTAILEIEYLERTKGPENSFSTEKGIEYQDALARLVSSLKAFEPASETSQSPFVCMFNFTKGIRAFLRSLRFLDSDQVMRMLSVLLIRFECLKVSNISTGTNSDEVDIFMSLVISLLVGVVSDASMIAVISLARIVLERHNMAWFAKSKAGLSILTMLLSRAEVLKQGAAGHSLPSDQELGMWSEIYNFMFQSMQGHFSALFPTNALSPDNVCVWQFMSAIAVGASGIDHQRVLVTEVRENVMHASKTGDPKALDNVNLFLNALGLGISAAQLAAMPS